MSPWHQLIQEIKNFPREIRDMRVSPQVSPEQVRAELANRYTFNSPIPLDALTENVINLLRAWTVHVTHPRYFGLFNPSVRQAASSRTRWWRCTTRNWPAGKFYPQLITVCNYYFQWVGENC